MIFYFILFYLGDLNGSIEFLKDYTNPDQPFFCYNVLNGLADHRIKYADNNILYMAFDSLPCLLPRDSSKHHNTTIIF